MVYGLLAGVDVTEVLSYDPTTIDGLAKPNKIC